jgi:hypothetical protein
MANDNTFDFFGEVATLDRNTTQTEKVVKKRKNYVKKNQEIEKIEENVKVEAIEPIIETKIEDTTINEIDLKPEISATEFIDEEKIEIQEEEKPEIKMEVEVKEDEKIKDIVSEKPKIKLPERKKICPNAIRQTYHIDNELAEKIKIYAYIARLGISEVVNEAVKEYLKDKNLNL